VNVLVVDDHALIREGLRQVLGQLGTEFRVHEARSFSEALAVADGMPDLDLVLLDLHLPGAEKFSALDALRERHPALPVIVISGFDDPQIVRGAIDRGAMGYIPKTSSPAVMLNAVRLVLSGGVYLPPEILARGGAQDQAPATARTPAARVVSAEGLGLTDRQADVLRLLVQGQSNKVICRELGLAEGTVKIHVTAILKALNVGSRAQAIVAVNRLGLNLDPPPRRGNAGQA